MVNLEGNPDLMLEVVSIDPLVQITSGAKIGVECAFQMGFWLTTIGG